MLEFFNVTSLRLSIFFADSMDRFVVRKRKSDGVVVATGKNSKDVEPEESRSVSASQFEKLLLPFYLCEQKTKKRKRQMQKK